MALVNRAQIARMIGIKSQVLYSRIKYGWKDFPHPVARVENVLLYDLDIITDYLAAKALKQEDAERIKKVKVNRKQALHGDYFTGCKFLRITPMIFNDEEMA